jgi:hypothetical protein
MHGGKGTFLFLFLSSYQRMPYLSSVAVTHVQRDLILLAGQGGYSRQYYKYVSSLIRVDVYKRSIAE